MSILFDLPHCDEIVNPGTGCDGCELWCDDRKTCYATAYSEDGGGIRLGDSRGFGSEITFWPGRMEEVAKLPDLIGLPHPDKPWLDGMPRVIGDAGDCFSESVPCDLLLNEIVSKIATEEGSRHTWIWPTRNPRRLAAFSNWMKAQGVAWPANLWPGTSVSTASHTRRIDDLLKVEGVMTRVLFVMPQWEPIDLRARLPRFAWVHQGGEDAGESAKSFHLEWIRDLRDQCQEAGTSYFLIGVGSRVFCQRRRIDPTTERAIE